MSEAARSAEWLEIQQRGGVIDLSARTRLLVRGGDRVRYLNGQVTANVTRLKTGAALTACVTTAKGKLCAEIVVTAFETQLLVDAHASLSESLRVRLERYVVADDVEIAPASGASRLLHFIGRLPPAVGLVANDRFGLPGWDWHASVDEIAHPENAWMSGRVRLDETWAESLRITAGRPRWGAELGEDTLPAEAGLDQTHIDFHKGCYIGQEVISRIKSIGHVNRHLAGFASKRLVPVGSKVVAEAAPDQECGVITSSAWSFALERPVALGYLRRVRPDGALVALPSETGPAGAEPIPLTVCELPFTK